MQIYTSFAMKGEKKSPKVPGFMRVVVGANVSKLLDHHYNHLPNITQRLRTLAKDSGIGYGTIQRIIDCKVGASLDNIEAIADALQVSVYQLMLPSLNVDNPQVVQGATEAEKALYRHWKRQRVAH